MTYEVILSPGARRALSEQLPDAVAAAFEFITGPLRENPRRVGKALRKDLAGSYSARRGEFRVIYDIDDDRIRIEVISIRHRRDAYRT